MILPGLVSVTFRQFSAEEVIALCLQHQLLGIEWGGDIHVPHGNEQIARQIGHATTDSGLKISAYGSYYRLGGTDVLFADVLKSAVALGAPLIRVWAGGIGSSESSAEEKRLVIEDAHRCSELARSEGIDLAMEFHGGTLNDSNESCCQLLAALPEDVRTHWQPLNHRNEEYCAAGLRAILPRLGSIHVFHWSSDGKQRHPLADAERVWLSYLDIARVSERDHYALLEFVKDDAVENLARDAATLRSILDHSAS